MRALSKKTEYQVEDGIHSGHLLVNQNQYKLLIFSFSFLDNAHESEQRPHMFTTVWKQWCVEDVFLIPSHEQKSERWAESRGHMAQLEVPGVPGQNREVETVYSLDWFGALSNARRTCKEPPAGTGTGTVLPRSVWQENVVNYLPQCWSPYPLSGWGCLIKTQQKNRKSSVWECHEVDDVNWNIIMRISTSLSGLSNMVILLS